MKYEEKLEKCVKGCAKKLNKLTDEQTNLLIEKFKPVKPKVTMKVLTQKLLDIYKDPTNIEFMELLEEIFILNDGSYSKPQDIIEEINKEKQKELEKNHKIVNESIQEVCNKFNELGIDYYIVGALPVYLESGKMIRKHEDIDFMVAEKDMSKVAKALQGTVYELHDYRLNSPRELDENGHLICGDHEVVADRQDDKFHLGFFMFKREKDGSVTQREYHARRDEKGNKIPVLLKRNFPKELFEYNYGNKPIKYLDAEFKCSTAESVYGIKSHMLTVEPRPKDKFDVENWQMLKKSNSEEPLISEERLKEMDRISNRCQQTHKSEDVSQELIQQILMQQEEMQNLEHKDFVDNKI